VNQGQNLDETDDPYYSLARCKRIQNPSIRPDLLGVELEDANLSFAYLSYADPRHADLSGTKLHRATLRHADLSSTKLQKADLAEADLSFSILQGADLGGADLDDALLDPDAIETRKKRFSGGVSYLEKLALRFFPRSKRKDRRLTDKENEPDGSANHLWPQAPNASLQKGTTSASP
jgi:uncharacterized protein YjbI with pentapeptide repeats